MTNNDNPDTLSRSVMCSDLSFLLKMYFDGQEQEFSPALALLYINAIICVRNYSINRNFIIHQNKIVPQIFCQVQYIGLGLIWLLD